jgi:hypothetical protein
LAQAIAPCKGIRKQWTTRDSRRQAIESIVLKLPHCNVRGTGLALIMTITIPHPPLHFAGAGFAVGGGW